MLTLVESAIRHLEAEAKMWGKLWQIAARVITLKNQKVLLMPFVKIILKQDDLSDDHKDATKAAIDKCVVAGYEHNDLTWRHVGFYFITKKGSKGKDIDQLCALFVDLSQVSKITTTPQAAAKKMITKLGL
jgi:hypothetical protein